MLGHRILLEARSIALGHVNIALLPVRRARIGVATPLAMWLCISGFAARWVSQSSVRTATRRMAVLSGPTFLVTISAVLMTGSRCARSVIDDLIIVESRPAKKVIRGPMRVRSSDPTGAVSVAFARRSDRERAVRQVRRTECIKRHMTGQRVMRPKMQLRCSI